MLKLLGLPHDNAYLHSAEPLDYISETACILKMMARLRYDLLE